MQPKLCKASHEALETSSCKTHLPNLTAFKNSSRRWITDLVLKAPANKRHPKRHKANTAREERKGTPPQYGIFKHASHSWGVHVHISYFKNKCKQYNSDPCYLPTHSSNHTHAYYVWTYIYIYVYIQDIYIYISYDSDHKPSLCIQCVPVEFVHVYTYLHVYTMYKYIYIYIYIYTCNHK